MTQPVHQFPSHEIPAIKRVMMPRDTNAVGTIFGGVILSEIDLAAATEAHKHHAGVIVTVSMDKIDFKAPVRVGDLVSFFTVGEDEVRAWPIRRGTNARQAAGRIHSDLERGFIRAEVTPYAVFMEYGSEAGVRDAGRLQIEGKDYVVADGDIMSIRFNV